MNDFFPTHERCNCAFLCSPALPHVLPLFAVIELFTQHELITHLLQMGPDWPWQPKQKQPSGLSPS